MMFVAGVIVGAVGAYFVQKYLEQKKVVVEVVEPETPADPQAK